MYSNRFSIRALFVVTAVVAICLTCHRAQRAWYMRHYAGYHVHSVLAAMAFFVPGPRYRKGLAVVASLDLSLIQFLVLLPRVL